MKLLNLDEIKIIQLDILLAFDSFCTKNNLTYWLAYGTLLGAIRHQGYIPWDDDIDIIMPYQDYRQFIDIINKQDNDAMLTNNFRVADYFIKSTIPYHQLFTKIYDIRTNVTSSTLQKSLGFREGVFIDIFCVSGLPDSSQDRKMIQSNLQHLADQVFYSTESLASVGIIHPRTLLKHAISKWKTLEKPYDQWIAEYKNLEEQLPTFGTTNSAIDTASSCYTNGFIYKISKWLPSRTTSFEGYELPIPYCAEQILEDSYGNYMQLPPEADRKPSHSQGFYIE